MDVGDRDALIDDLVLRLRAIADAGKKAWWERYLKGVIPFHGVGIPDIRTTLLEWYGEHAVVERSSPIERIALAADLLRRQVAEEKLAGILLLQVRLLPQGDLDWRRDLPLLADLFDAGHVADWSTCDWLCVRVLGPIAEQDWPQAALAIAAWREAPVLWRRRAAAVSFVNLAPHGDAGFPGLTGIALEVAHALLESRERFLQTAVGWLVRELSRAEAQRSSEFVAAELPRFTRESLRMAVAKLPEEQRRRLLDRHRQVRTHTG